MLRNNVLQKPVDTLEYREHSVTFYYDDDTQQFYTMWENDILAFGSLNTEYKKDMKHIIDDKLDLIFKDNFTRLEFFDNGENRDIKLSFRGRIIKIYLLNSSNIQIEKIRVDAKQTIRKYLSAKLSSCGETLQ